MRNMHRRRILALLITNCLLLIFLAGCNWVGVPNDYGKFDYDLRGTWASSDPSVYSGTLEIDYNTIAIKGYEAIQTQNEPLKDDAKRPFRNFTKNVPLKGYSEEGKIFIHDVGTWQAGMSYEYYTAGTYPQVRFLRITFGGREEILRRQ